MKKIIISLACAIIGSLASFAADINASWNQISANNQLVKIDVPVQNATAKGFESMSLVAGENLADTNVTAINAIMNNVSDAQELADQTVDGARVRIFAQPVNNDSQYAILLFCQQGKDTIVVIKAISKDNNLQAALKNLDLEQMIK